MRKKMPYIILFLLVFGIVIFGVMMTLDFEPPEIKFAVEPEFITKTGDITLTFHDGKSGIKSFQVTLQQENYKKDLIKDGFPKSGVRKKDLKITVNPRSLGFKEGKAILTVSALDYSILENEAKTEKEVIIDTQPPRVELASLSHYINIGGSCLAVYYVSKDAERNGVLVDDRFFPGYPLLAEGPNVAYFGLPWDSSPDLPIMIEAEDRAGNINSLSLPHLVIKKKFRSDKINISDNFLNRKMPEFSAQCERLGDTNLEIYLTVNQELRQKNHLRIKHICSSPSPDRLWEGPFLRMKGSPRALYADLRTYYYKGKVIDTQVHLGVDIAALEHYPVGAANRGLIIFAEYLGIYGNTVIIDHGQGLFSMYSHLSSIKLDAGQEVPRGEVIGYTGTSGLAGGDHLHFGMMLHGMTVNPGEWWDPHWIQDNIDIKLNPYLIAPASDEN